MVAAYYSSITEYKLKVVNIQNMGSEETLRWHL